MTFSKEQLEEMAASVPFWFHSISLGSDVVTKGHKSQAAMANELQSLKLPDVQGCSVLDINSFDGFYAFEAERRGAKRVVALDHYMWAMDLAEHIKYYYECRESGVTPAPYHTMSYYRPDTLPGKAGFDTAHRALASRVETCVGDFMEMDLKSLGTFDVVFFLGSLYHMENPLLALRRVAEVTRKVAVIETEAAEFPGAEDDALFEFFGAGELEGDVSNWWAPNEKALLSMCRAAGFNRVEVVVGSPITEQSSLRKPFRAKVRSLLSSGFRKLTNRAMFPKLREKARYRAVVHAWK